MKPVLAQIGRDLTDSDIPTVAAVVPRAAIPSGPIANRGWRVLAVLSALMGFASISTDLYLPAMPAMGQALGATTGLMELTVSGYLVGFSLGQLLWGPIGDRYGRRVPVAIGLVLFVIGSAGCALSDSASAMIFWRVVQAVGACAGVALARAMVRDLYEGHRAAQMLSTLMTVMAIAPLLGPVIGGQILSLAGWRAIFWTLVGVGVLTLAALFTIPETLPAKRRNREPLRGSLLRYGQLLKQRQLLGYAGTGGFFYGGIYAYVAGTPFAYISYHHVPPQFYGLLFGVGIIGIMATNLINSWIVARFGSARLLVHGTKLAAVSGVVLAATAWTGWGGLWDLVLPLFVFVSATGFIVANSIAGALSDFPERAGAVSALVGAIHYGSGIIGSALVGAFADGTPWPMAWVIALAGLGSVSCAWLIKPTARA
ncbi:MULTISPECIES: multidrug effflux MFS transporter [unclassified Beijerinckia]|uniref:multidrug effflux MFS transporter n=1 Tax=unclassified Beijerinckia TaxID=2638183 RepID=UPI00089707DD|nr:MULTISPECIES: multidrug effflux MFS transporter [unclassified Beijerinckia]MDH7795425.1 DHA1 family bicyclomycin/chloramphenicol resistance-like MFS transporter [Beijerinckia sp. GAS462]SEC01001.1 MFS transporter, DHA1 family, bicyclomycin/chloramphenicol resistance protein [Beijerinckia sp. 28-YEA-48]